MPQTYTPSGSVGTSLTEATVAEAATGTHGQTFMKDNIEAIANKIRFLLDSGLYQPVGLLDLSNGASGQISFPATQNPSAGVNVLDDYEEGTWTPIDSSGASLTFSTPLGAYEKIGRLVIARCSLVYPATADGSNALIGGLPFAGSNTPPARQGFVSFTTEATLVRALPQQGGTTIAPLTAAGGNITNATFSTDTVFLTAVYYI